MLGYRLSFQIDIDVVSCISPLNKNLFATEEVSSHNPRPINPCICVAGNYGAKQHNQLLHAGCVDDFEFVLELLCIRQKGMVNPWSVKTCVDL